MPKRFDFPSTLLCRDAAWRSQPLYTAIFDVDEQFREQTV